MRATRLQNLRVARTRLPGCARRARAPPAHVTADTVRREREGGSGRLRSAAQALWGRVEPMLPLGGKMAAKGTWSSPGA